MNIYIWCSFHEECVNIINILNDIIDIKLTIVKNPDEANIILANTWKPNIKININKPIIYWSGESYRSQIFNNNVPYIEFNSYIDNVNKTHIYFPYCVLSPYWSRNIKQIDNDKQFFIAFCVSNSSAYSNCKNRINIFNRFCELLPEKEIHALGQIYGNYKKNHRPLNGSHLTFNTIQEYSKYKFVLAIENNIKEGYVTEKIMNVFAAGSIPIYQGCSKTVVKQFNKNSYIDINNFASLDECISYVNNISQEKYNEMLSHNIYNITSPDILNIFDNDQKDYSSEYWINIKRQVDLFLENINS